ncbi:hypothetical protein SUGI_0994940 [Cryptomeria japonica]|uniref:homeotic protein knotted-1 n=1 Tax=Cryptomeria japonica TaxID=3369 RepID=UPI002414B63D|nr:homeotic protein knotted-1 [Cryptomeria japonica]GLJ47123.1 hypothetical protein SUGI_0994940 [Cryptomeria japonica]
MDNLNTHLLNPVASETRVLGGKKRSNPVDKLLSLQDFENSEELSNLFLAPELQAQWLRPLQAGHGGFYLPTGQRPPPEAVEEVGSSTDDINPSMEEERKRSRNIDQDQDSDSVDSACASNTPHGNPEHAIEAEHIYSHPLFRRFLTGQIECSKVGVSDQTPVAQLDQLEEQYRALSTTSMPIGSHSDLDQFMVAYCALLESHRGEMTKIFSETQDFLKTLEKTMEVIRMRNPSGLRNRVCSSGPQKSSQAMDMEAKLHATIHAMVEERKQPPTTKHQMTQISKVTKELKEEFNSQRTKRYSRLPEEATMILQEWWDKNHEVNPYPSKDDKVEFVRRTGLEIKQIENWFSNQRKKLH